MTFVRFSAVRKWLYSTAVKLALFWAAVLCIKKNRELNVRMVPINAHGSSSSWLANICIIFITSAERMFYSTCTIKNLPAKKPGFNRNLPDPY